MIWFIGLVTMGAPPTFPFLSYSSFIHSLPLLSLFLSLPPCLPIFLPSFFPSPFSYPSPSLPSFLLSSLPPIYLPFSLLSSLTPSLPSFLLSSLPLFIYPSSWYLPALLSSSLSSFLPSPNLSTVFSHFLPLSSFSYFLSSFLPWIDQDSFFFPLYYLNCI